MDKIQFANDLLIVSIFSLYLFCKKKIHAFLILSLPGIIVAISAYTIEEPFRNFYIFELCFLMLAVAIYAYKNNELKNLPPLHSFFDKIDWVLFIAVVFITMIIHDLN